VARVRDGLAGREHRSYDLTDEQLTPSVSWSAYSLRKDWNQVKDEVAPWWAENSKEAFRVALRQVRLDTCQTPVERAPLPTAVRPRRAVLSGSGVERELVRLKDCAHSAASPGSCLVAVTARMARLRAPLRDIRTYTTARQLVLSSASTTIVPEPPVRRLGAHPEGPRPLSQLNQRIETHVRSRMLTNLRTVANLVPEHRPHMV
jgi:hypothetical protein